MNIDEIRGRYQRALDAKPSKGDYTPDGIAANANRIANISRELQRVIDEHVTARALRLEAIHAIAQEIADHYGDTWPHHGGCLNDGANGCSLCQILALSRSAGAR